MSSPVPFKSKEEFLEAYNRELLAIQNKLISDEPQLDLPVIHDFAPGIYGRRLFMPAGAFVIGKTHKTKHFNIVLSGLANTLMNGEFSVAKAGDVIISEKGVKKVFYILEDMTWMTLHPTDMISSTEGTPADLGELEDHFVLSDAEEQKMLSTGNKLIKEKS